ncbi:LrgB family protein [Halalkalibacter sp. APA_J-10(15)]|uniref:LrgB family protein n=1 Tax=Halalkalibacter sp. APA_J-10(15) TaxID=2933805 RepID=UPI001FF1F39B|nr:LrgB family protein [Halalkalibacter sp. APA_J-10(15)]MCK0471269.1 LrgB family protein [Halalkalibacter sp. APA_J-10(15)]
MIVGVTLFGFSLTLLAYILAKAVYKRIRIPFLLPVLTATASIMILLTVFNVSYETYYIGAQWFDHLLGPAVVALALPLYRQLPLVIKYLRTILVSVSIGAVIGVSTGLLLAGELGVKEELQLSIVPKSVTAPVAMDVAASLGGVPALAAVFVAVAGIGGSVISSYIFQLAHIHHPLARGIGLGCASHAIGTAKALEYGEQEGAISSIAMTISAIVVSIIAPLLVFLLY